MDVLLLLVFTAVAVLAVVVLGGLAYALVGARGRLYRETTALQQEVAPLAAELQASLAARPQPSDA